MKTILCLHAAANQLLLEEAVARAAQPLPIVLKPIVNEELLAMIQLQKPIDLLK